MRHSRPPARHVHDQPGWRVAACSDLARRDACPAQPLSRTGVQNLATFSPIQIYIGSDGILPTASRGFCWQQWCAHCSGPRLSIGIRNPPGREGRPPCGPSQPEAASHLLMIQTWSKATGCDNRTLCHWQRQSNSSRPARLAVPAHLLVPGAAAARALPLPSDRHALHAGLWGATSVGLISVQRGTVQFKGQSKHR